MATAVTAGAAAALSTPVDSETAARPAPSAAPLGVAHASAPGADNTAPTPAPWELLHPLALGSAVAHGWSVAGLTDIVDGSCVLTLQNTRGRTQRVHLCRNDGRPQGLVYTERFDLLVMNGGQGDLPSEETMAQAVATVAHAIAANEAKERQAQVLAALLPHTERVERFASAAKLR